jgi:hypothetical protein
MGRKDGTLLSVSSRGAHANVHLRACGLEQEDTLERLAPDWLTRMPEEDMEDWLSELDGIRCSEIKVWDLDQSKDSDFLNKLLAFRPERLLVRDCVLTNLPQLDVPFLKLQCCSFGERAGAMPNLRSLVLLHCNLTALETRAVGIIIQQSTGISGVALRNTTVRDDAAELTKGLRLPHVSDLMFGGVTGIDMPAVLMQRDSLLSLIDYHSELDPGTIVRILERHSRLEYLDIYWKRIPDVRADLISHPSLKYVEFADSTLKEALKRKCRFNRRKTLVHWRDALESRG